MHRASMGLSLLAAASLGPGAIAGTEPAKAPIRVRMEWLELPAPKDVGDGQPVTYSAMQFFRAIDPDTGKPFDATYRQLGADPRHVRRQFALEGRRFLLGEPIVLEFRVALLGPGTWREETYGRNRVRRNPHLFLLMRHADGTWVRDPYGPGYGRGHGGVIANRVVRQGKSDSQWFGVQRWCLVDRPGTYDLYCFQLERGHPMIGDHPPPDRRAGKPSNEAPASQTNHRPHSPLLDRVPAHVRRRAAAHFEAGRISDFAHLRLEIRQGTRAEEDAMTRRWTALAARDPRERQVGHPIPEKVHGIRDAIVWARQDHFLPLLEKWIDRPSIDVAFSPAKWECVKGLAVRASARAMARLMGLGRARAFWVLATLHANHRPRLVPWLIRWATHDDPEVRRKAVAWLRGWTGQRFEPERPPGAGARELSLDDCRQIQRMAEHWWQRHRAELAASPARR